MNKNKQENKKNIDEIIFKLFETMGKLQGNLNKEMNKIEKYVKNREEYNPNLDYVERMGSDIISLGKGLNELYEIRDILNSEK